MQDGHDHAQQITAADLVLAADAPSGTERPVQLAQAPEPVDVPRPPANETITVTVISGRPLKLAFSVNDVKDREVVRDDLVLGFDNGGKVVLKDYMQAFGMLGEQRTTIIQPDGKHYAFTELLAPGAGQPERPPSTSGDVVIIQKPPPGETQSFKLTADKPMALNFGMSDVARTDLRDGNLILTFKDGGILILEGYAALKGNVIGIYFAKGDKIALTDLAPGAGPESSAEGGHLFTEFALGGSLGGLDHLAALAPLPFTLIPPPGPPESPPPLVPPPPHGPPPHVPPPHECLPPPPHKPPHHHHHHHTHHKPPPHDCAPVCEPRHDDHKDHHRDHGHGHKLVWVTAPGCIVDGDVHGRDGRGHDRHDGDSHGGPHRGAHDAHRPHGDHQHIAWSDGHDPRGSHDHDHGGGGDHAMHGRDHHGHNDIAAHGHHELAAWDGGRGHEAHLVHKPGHDGVPAHDHGGFSHHATQGHDHAALSPRDVFAGHDNHAAPKHAGDHGAAVHFAAAHDFAAVMAAAHLDAAHIQNHAHHNVMGH